MGLERLQYRAHAHAADFPLDIDSRSTHAVRVHGALSLVCHSNVGICLTISSREIKSFGNNFSLSLDDVTDTGVLQASYSSPRLSREGDMLDGLIRFVRSISLHEDMILWGSQPDALKAECVYCDIFRDETL